MGGQYVRSISEMRKLRFREYKHLVQGLETGKRQASGKSRHTMFHSGAERKLSNVCISENVYYLNLPEFIS